MTTHKPDFYSQFLSNYHEYHKNILLDKAMQEEPHGIGIMPEIPTTISPDELAQRERDYTLQRALGSVKP